MRLGPASVKSGKPGKPKLFVTDGVDAPLSGTCVFFLRANPSKPIAPENVHKVSHSIIVYLLRNSLYKVLLSGVTLLMFS